MRVKKATKLSRSTRAKKKTATHKTTRSSIDVQAAPVVNLVRAPGAMDRWWIAFAVVCVVGVVALIGVPSASRRGDSTRAAVQSDDSEPQDTAALAPLLDTAKPASKSAAKTAARTRAADQSILSTRTTKSEKTPTLDSRANAASMGNVQSTPSADVSGTAPVTIQGCLQAGDSAFWLKDTSGANAPTSRSWKSGFLKKRSASVEVVDATAALQLSNYVGQRVAATGTVTNRRMQAHSLHRVAGSCN